MEFRCGRRKYDLDYMDRMERENIKKEMILGADYLNQDDELKIFIVKTKTCIEKFCSCLNQIINFLIPFYGDIQYLKVVL